MGLPFREYVRQQHEEARRVAEIRENHSSSKLTQDKRKGPRCTLCPVVGKFPLQCGSCEGT